MRTQPAKINLLDAYWSHNIPVCDIFCVYSKPPTAELCFKLLVARVLQLCARPSVVTLTGLAAAALPFLCLAPSQRSNATPDLL